MNLTTRNFFFFLSLQMYVWYTSAFVFMLIHLYMHMPQYVWRSKDNLRHWSSLSTFLETGFLVSCYRFQLSWPKSPCLLPPFFYLSSYFTAGRTEITDGSPPFLHRFWGSKFRCSYFPSMCLAHRFDSLMKYLKPQDKKWPGSVVECSALDGI